jgi:2,3-bisphosphoglycerate-independent phosphoglycerate mutase
MQQQNTAIMAPSKPLEPHATISRADKPVLVCILDGWGENEAKDKFNAIHVAQTPTTDALKV